MRSLIAALCGTLAAGWPLGRVAAQMDMSGMARAAGPPLGIPENRMGSGTSWLPDDAPMRAIHAPLGAWTVMAHGAISLMLDAQGGPRGATEVRLVNWGMGSLTRDIAGGRLELRAMLSTEPRTVGSGGYPLLLQSGESDNGLPLHDRQHPHDLFMEAAALYERGIGGTMAVLLYLAPAGEPALGPPAYPHRPSAEWDPLAPIGHHWQDGAHVTYGVLTTGIYTRSMKLEVSAFNGREPDEDRTDFDFRGRRLDSYAGRAIVNPSRGLSVSAWYGYLRSPEAHEPAWRETLVDFARLRSQCRTGLESLVQQRTARWQRRPRSDEHRVRQTRVRAEVSGRSGRAECEQCPLRCRRGFARLLPNAAANGGRHSGRRCARHGQPGATITAGQLRRRWPVGAAVYVALRPRDTKHGHSSGDSR